MSEAKMMSIVDPVTGEVVGEFLMHKGRAMTVDGAELPDPTPMAPPVNYKRQPSMFEIVREQMRRQAAELAAATGAESEEEADDFDVGDDDELRTQYEVYDQSIDELREELRLPPQSAASADDERPAGPEPKETKSPIAKPKKAGPRAPESQEDGSDED